MSCLRDYLIKLSVGKGITANKFRRKRFSIFITFIKSLEVTNKLRILDVGGTINYWEKLDFVNNKNTEITILNLTKEKSPYPNVKCIIGNGAI